MIGKYVSIIVERDNKIWNFITQKSDKTLYPGLEYKIILSYSSKEKVLIFHNQDLGSGERLEDYETVYHAKEKE